MGRQKGRSKKKDTEEEDLEDIEESISPDSFPSIQWLSPWESCTVHTHLNHLNPESQCFLMQNNTNPSIRYVANFGSHEDTFMLMGQEVTLPGRSYRIMNDMTLQIFVNQMHSQTGEPTIA